MTSQLEGDTKPISGTPLKGDAGSNGGSATSKNKKPADEGRDEVADAHAAVTQKWAVKTAKAKAKTKGKTDLAQARLDGIDADEQLDLRKARRKKRQLTDAGAHLAKTYRRHRMLSWVLSLGTLGGIAWTSYGVAHALGGPSPMPLFYLVEPLFSVPLLCIVFLQIVAAENGRLARLKPFYRKPGGWMYWPTITGVIELGLLSLTVLINTWPVITAPQFHFEAFATRAFAPMMIVVFVLLQLVASELFSEIIREARVEDEESELNLRRQAERGLDLALEVQRAMSGDNPLPVSPESGQPSISQILKRFPNEKVTGQIAHDALIRFQQERKEVQT